MLFGKKFNLISLIIFGAKSEEDQIDSLKLGNFFNELLAKLLYLLPQSILKKVVSATGFEPVTH
jgi:hypothetical protein